MKTKSIFSSVLMCVTVALLIANRSALAQTDYTWINFAGSPYSSGTADGSGTNARFNDPVGVTVDSSGKVYVADLNNQSIRVITPSGSVTTLTGTGLDQPEGIAVDSGSYVYVADAASYLIRTVSPSGGVSTLAGHKASPYWLNGTGTNAEFYIPMGVAVDSGGNVYVADTENDVIREISSGNVVTLAGQPQNRGSTDGIGSTAMFNLPDSVAVDHAGNLYVADSANKVIRMMQNTSGTWNVTTIAGVAGVNGDTDGSGTNARFDDPTAIAVDSAGNLYVTDDYYYNVRKLTLVSGTWNVTTIGSSFERPLGIAVDSSGNVYVSNSGNHTISKGVPSTPVDVYISGAPTFRAPVTAAIMDQTNGILVSGSTTCAYTGTNVYKASAAIFHGYLKGSGESLQEVFIHTYWSGSVTGVYDVALPNSFTGWIEDPAGGNISNVIPGTTIVMQAVTGSNPATISSSYYAQLPSTYTQGTHYPDAVMSDAWAGSVATVFSTAGNGFALGEPTGTELKNTVTGADLKACGNSTRNTSSSAQTEGYVGIAPMLWVLGNSSIAPNFTDLNQQTAISLFEQGAESAMLCSGSTADENNYVVLVGCSEDSGARIAALAETQSGLINANGINQYLPEFSSNQATQPASPGYPTSGNPSIPEGGAGATVTALDFWPSDWCLNTDNSIDWGAGGYSGFTNGSDLANCLAATNPVTGLAFNTSSIYGDVSNGGSVGDNYSNTPTFFNGCSEVWLVGYLGIADAVGSGSFSGQTLSGGAGVPGGLVLSYNGVQYNNIQSVENGRYTFWVYEHMYYNQNNADTNSSTNPQKQCVDDIADAVFTTFAPTNTSGAIDPTGATLNVVGILSGSMNVARGIEGSVPYANH